MRRRRAPALALATVAAVAVVVVLALSAGGDGRPRAHRAPPPVSPPPQQQPVPEFGVNVNRLFNDGTFSQSEIDAQLAALHATGATLARSDALWEASEPAPPDGSLHHFVWSFDDEIAGSLAAHGLRWLPIVDYSAPWAQSRPGVDHSPPTSYSDYAAYAAALAMRYGQGGTFWRSHPDLPRLPVETYEIWNEPDNPVFWEPVPNPGAYAALYIAARAAIHGADPRAVVLVGGLSNPARFLPAMLTAAPGLRTGIDGVAVHPYGADAAAVIAHIAADRALLGTLGLAATPLYVTEFGWSTQPAGAPDYGAAALRPRYIAQTLYDLGHSGCGVAAALLYTWVTPRRDPRDTEDWFGISPPSGPPGAGPDVAAFTLGLKAATTPSSTASPACP